MPESAAVPPPPPPRPDERLIGEIEKPRARTSATSPYPLDRVQDIIDRLSELGVTDEELEPVRAWVRRQGGDDDAE